MTKEYMAQAEGKKYIISMEDGEHIKFEITSDHNDDALITRGETVWLYLDEEEETVTAYEVWFYVLSPVTKKRVYHEIEYKLPSIDSIEVKEEILRDVNSLENIPENDRTIRIINMVKRIHNTYAI